MAEPIDQITINGEMREFQDAAARDSIKIQEQELKALQAKYDRLYNTLFDKNGNFKFQTDEETKNKVEQLISAGQLSSVIIQKDDGTYEWPVKDLSRYEACGYVLSSKGGSAGVTIYKDGQEYNSRAYIVISRSIDGSDFEYYGETAILGTYNWYVDTANTSFKIDCYKDSSVKDLLCSTVVSPGRTGATGKQGQPSYKVELTSTNGVIFKNGLTNTQLQCRIYSGTEEITDTITSFTWKKYSVDGKPVLENHWPVTTNANSLQLGENDVDTKNVFVCEVELDNTKTYGSITLIDVTDVGQLSVTPITTWGNIITYNPTSESYFPDISSEECEISAFVYYGGELIENNVSLFWFKNNIDNPETLEDTINIAEDFKNIQENKTITYYVKAEYEVEGLSAVAWNHISVTLLVTDSVEGLSASDLTLSTTTTAFGNGVNEITIIPFLIKNGSKLDDVSTENVVWKVNGVEQNAGIDIENKSICINKDSVNGSATISCTWITDDIPISKYLFLQDFNDEFRCELISSFGDKIVNGNGFGYVYCKLYRNGFEINKIITLPTVTKESHDLSGILTQPVEGLDISYDWSYFIQDNSGNLVKVEGDALENYPTTGKCIYIDDTLVNKKLVINCDVNISYEQ